MDRKKMLEALVAKRKADAENTEKNKRKKPTKVAPAPILSSKPAIKPSKPSKPSVSPATKKTSSVKKKSSTSIPEKEKPKRVSKLDMYEADFVVDSDEEDDEEEESASDTDSNDDVSDEDSENDRMKQKSKAKKAPVNQHKGKSSNSKGKAPIKSKGKSKHSSSGSDEEDDSDVSDDLLDEVDPGNIISTRTKRRAAQAASLKSNILSDASEDDDSD